MSVLKDSSDTSPSILTDDEIAAFYMQTYNFSTLEKKQTAMNLIRRYTPEFQLYFAEILTSRYGKMSPERLVEIRRIVTTEEG